MSIRSHYLIKRHHWYSNKVKAVNYILADNKPVNFVKSNDKTAKATVSLKKEPTEFYAFMTKDSNSDFITKTYKLKFKKDSGWEVE